MKKHLRVLLLAALVCATGMFEWYNISNAALISGIAWEVEEGSSNNDGASFNTSVTGFPTDGAATSATGTAPVFTSVSYNFVSGDVGAWVFIKSGTNWTPGWYKIASVASNAATLTASIGAGVGYPSFYLATVAGIATTASPTSATWGIDYSQQASAQFAFTDMVTVTTTFTSVANAVGVNFVGNGIQIVSGSGCTAGFHTIVSTSGTTATLDSTGGTGTCTANLGGALGTLVELNTALSTTGNIYQTAWVKANATYSISGAVAFNIGASNKGIATNVNGYTTTRGDNGQATVQASAGSFTLVSIANNNGLSNFTFRNFVVDCNSKTTSNGFLFNSNGNNAENLKVENCTGAYGISYGTFAAVTCRNCWVTNYTGSSVAYNMGNSAGYIDEKCIWCFSTGNLGDGFTIVPSFNCLYCISSGNSGSGFLVGGSSVAAALLMNVDAYNNTLDGLRYTGDITAGNSLLMVLNSIFVSNGGYGIDNTGTTGLIGGYGAIEDFNGFYNNASGQTHGIIQGRHDVTLTGNPFVNAGTLNFSLNATSGAGLALYGVGYPGVLQTGGTGYLDIGTLQHKLAATGIAIGFVGP